MKHSYGCIKLTKEFVFTVRRRYPEYNLSDVISQCCVLVHIRCRLHDYLSTSKPIYFKFCAEVDNMQDYNLNVAF